MSDSFEEKYPGRSVHREGNQIVVTIPVKFYRRNGRQMLVSKSNSNNSASDIRKGINKELILAIAKAHRWQEQLESGEYETLEELAKANDVDRTYVGQLLRLTSLSPTLVEQIVAGNEPPNLSLRQLRKGIPAIWSEQA